MNDTSDQKGNIFSDEGVTLTGSFSITGRVVVNGTLNGGPSTAKLLMGKQGQLNGQITAYNADVHGKTNNKRTAIHHLVMHGTGRVNGRASYGGREIERGGLVANSIVPAAARGLDSHPQMPPVLNVRADGALASEAVSTVATNGNADSSDKAG